MRNLLRLMALLCLATGVCLAAPTAAGASTGIRSQAAAPCPGGTSYPVSASAMIKVSTTAPYIGETIKVSGQAFCPNEVVRIYVNGHLRATTQSDASGAFDPSLKITGPAGDQTLTGVGASAQPNDEDSLVLHVHAQQGIAGESIVAGGSGNASASGGASGLALTGEDIALIVLVAALLLGGGTALTVAARRRRSVN